MAQANKTRWTEAWQAGGAAQVARMRVVEDSNYNESVVVTLLPITATLPNTKVNRVAILAQQLKWKYGK